MMWLQLYAQLIVFGHITVGKNNDWPLSWDSLGRFGWGLHPVPDTRVANIVLTEMVVSGDLGRLAVILWLVGSVLITNRKPCLKIIGQPSWIFDIEFS